MTIEIRSPTSNARACAKKLCFGCVKSIFWYVMERYWPFVNHCEVLKGWVESNCAMWNHVKTYIKTWNVFIYIIKIKMEITWRMHQWWSRKIIM
jgi:hypothetical protein